jgi:hypothetical protein
MTSPACIPLSPCDCMVLNHHCLMKRELQGDYQCLMAVDVEGHVEPQRIQQALALAMTAHPATIAGLRIGLMWGTPYWRLPASIENSAHRAAAMAHRFIDLRDDPDDADRLSQSIHASCAESWDYAAGPQIRLDQYALADGRTRFYLRWPHFLTDAEGAQQFLRDIAHFDKTDSRGCSFPAAPSPQASPADHEMIDPLAERSTTQRIGLFRRALAAMRESPGGRVNSLHPQRFPPAAGHRLLHRHWDDESVGRMHAIAKTAAPAGPGLYARFLVTCVIRALHRVYVQHGVDTDAYVITMPVRVTLPAQAGRASRSRPVPGNYLVPLTIYGRRELIKDTQALGNDILRQYRRFLDDRMDLLWCSVMWMLSHLRLSMYQSLLKLRLGYLPLASGFSYYGEIDPPIRYFGGAKVTNLWGTSLVATPPGWNPAFSRFGRGLNLSLTYACPAVSGELAGQYANYIEEEMFRPA